MNTTHYELIDGAAVIRIDNPPVNGQSHAVRSSLVTHLLQADNDPAVRAVVIIGSAAAFSGGADITEFGTPKLLAEPTLPAVVATLDVLEKPVIAAIGGTCMGGGLELALACHYRVVAPDAQISLPEVKLGLLPGAGGTQRLPRLLGVEHALNLIVSGATVRAEQFWGSALFDRFLDGDLLEGALSFARKVIDEEMPVRRVRDLPVSHPQPEAFFMFARNAIGQMAKNYPAPRKCVDAVAASLKPFDDGLAVERIAFGQLFLSDESKALRHLFQAERSAAKVTGIADGTAPRTINSVGIVGAGTMGSGIAINFLQANLPVLLIDNTQEFLDRGVAAIRGHFDGQVAKRKLKAEKAEAMLARLAAATSLEALAGADLVIEAVFEDMAVKEKVFRQLDTICKSGAILASNTSTLDIDRIAQLTKRPQDVVGLHFFSPAQVMKLLEIVRGAQTADDVMVTAMKLAKTIRKTAVVSGVCDGFIGNRMVGKYITEACLLLEEGASVAQIDGALEAFGWAMGPFKMSDLAGNDIGWAIRKRWYAEHPDTRTLLVADRLCQAGRFGQKAGQGWYRYATGRRDAIPDPTVDELVANCRAELGITPRAIGDQEIVQRCVFALINEGARLLDEGIAQRASDIDIVYIFGYGFPPHRGGPMLYADTTGLRNVEHAMRQFSRRGGPTSAFWEPAPLLRKLVAAGRSFN